MIASNKILLSEEGNSRTLLYSIGAFNKASRILHQDLLDSLYSQNYGVPEAPHLMPEPNLLSPVGYSRAFNLGRPFTVVPHILLVGFQRS